MRSMTMMMMMMSLVAAVLSGGIVEKFKKGDYVRLKGEAESPPDDDVCIVVHPSRGSIVFTENKRGGYSRCTGNIGMGGRDQEELELDAQRPVIQQQLKDYSSKVLGPTPELAKIDFEEFYGLIWNAKGKQLEDPDISEEGELWKKLVAKAKFDLEIGNQENVKCMGEVKGEVSKCRELIVKEAKCREPVEVFLQHCELVVTDGVCRTERDIVDHPCEVCRNHADCEHPRSDCQHADCRWRLPKYKSQYDDKCAKDSPMNSICGDKSLMVENVKLKEQLATLQKGRESLKLENNELKKQLATLQKGGESALVESPKLDNNELKKQLATLQKGGESSEVESLKFENNELKEQLATLQKGGESSNVTTYVMIGMGVLLVAVALFLFTGRPTRTGTRERLGGSVTELGECAS